MLSERTSFPRLLAPSSYVIEYEGLTTWENANQQASSWVSWERDRIGKGHRSYASRSVRDVPIATMLGQLPGRSKFPELPDCANASTATRSLGRARNDGLRDVRGGIKAGGCAGARRAGALRPPVTAARTMEIARRHGRRAWSTQSSRAMPRSSPGGSCSIPRTGRGGVGAMPSNFWRSRPSS